LEAVAPVSGHAQQETGLPEGGRELWLVMLGTRSYGEMLAAQEDLVERRRAGETPDLLMVLEHPPTYTRGRRSEPADLHRDPDWYREHGIEVFDTPRGGKVTYHGPGQLVAYPVVDLRGLEGRRGPGGESRGDGQAAVTGRTDVAGFVSALEDAMVRTVARWRIPAGTIDGLTGIWTGDGDPIPDDADAASMTPAVAAGSVRKIGSIGLRISRGVSSHGVSINLDCDLEPFAGITSCGIEHCRVTSVRAETGDGPTVDSAGLALGEELAGILGRRLFVIDPESIGLSARLPAKA
jgi:lipoyl(octanoyl) transferase